ncbi:hypothetical protein HYU09_01340 [Candidatus Woesearchaeota archaeon]|nr:hypothetical protein [Candidatus Woesearchaeota archaeon]
MGWFQNWRSKRELRAIAEIESVLRAEDIQIRGMYQCLEELKSKLSRNDFSGLPDLSKKFASLLKQVNLEESIVTKLGKRRLWSTVWKELRSELR